MRQSHDVDWALKWSSDSQITQTGQDSLKLAFVVVR